MKQIEGNCYDKETIFWFTESVTDRYPFYVMKPIENFSWEDLRKQIEDPPAGAD